MAYTCVRVIFEVGHEANVRSKVTPQGFTHDWELFIRGADNTDIQHFVDKVVFHIHESFQNPRRVVKEPPYSIRESGYAGFPLVVEVYLKNKSPSEPNKIRFNYHLTLQEIDQPKLINFNKETYVFSNPSEDFRRKLIKGGGVGVGANSTSSSHSSHMAALNSNHSVDDHKNSGSKNRPSLPEGSIKKSKKENLWKHEEQLNQNDPFSIFGAPIIKNKIPYTTTKSNSKPISDKISQPPEKQEHSSSKSSKHNSSSHKDKDRDKDKDKERDKEKSKERDKEKEKSNSGLKKSRDEPALKREKNKDDKDKILKSSKEDSKMKNQYHEEKQKEKEKSVEKSEKEIKAGKKEKEKKHKEEKKLKSKEKHKIDNKKENIVVHENYAERNEKVTKEDATSLKDEKKVQKLVSEDKEEKIPKDKSSDLKSLYNNNSSNNSSSNNNNSSNSNNNLSALSANNQSVVGTFDSIKKEEKHKHHKHKKDKSKKDSKRDKEEKKEKIKETKESSKEKITPVQVEQPKSTPKSDSPKRLKKPLKTLFDELTDKSDSETSSDDDMNVPTIKEPDSPPVLPPSVKESTPIYSRQENQAKEEKVESASSKKKNKKSVEEKESKKRKRKSKHKDENPVVKMSKYEEHTADNLQQNAPAMLDLQQPRQTSVSPASEPKFTDEYITKLKELQRKIMTLDDNSGLQRIVQVVAETGQYEITTKTFDFDLCTLDESIVQRLLDFFVP